jgi:hypothetical protein
MRNLSDIHGDINEELPHIAGAVGTPDIIPFDAASVSGATDPDDDDDSDNDDNTPLEPTPAVAIGLACHRGPKVVAPPQLAYSLCVVQILRDPGYPATTDDPDYIADGQEMLAFEFAHDATAACDRYASRPDLLPLIEVRGVTHVVVNYFDGTELYRRPIRVAA